MGKVIVAADLMDWLGESGPKHVTLVDGLTIGGLPGLGGANPSAAIIVETSPGSFVLAHTTVRDLLDACEALRAAYGLPAPRSPAS